MYSGEKTHLMIEELRGRISLKAFNFLVISIIAEILQVFQIKKWFIFISDFYPNHNFTLAIILS